MAVGVAPPESHEDLHLHLLAQADEIGEVVILGDGLHLLAVHAALFKGEAELAADDGLLF